jgi:hypothetical protein
MTRVTPHADQRSRLRTLSGAMAIACLLLVLLLPLAVAVFWAVGDVGALAARVHLVPGAVAAPGQPWQRLAGALLTGAALAPLLVGLWHARRCFGLFARGDVFTHRAVRYLQGFAGWSLVSVVAGIAAGAAVSVVLTWHNPPGTRHLAIGLGTDQVFMVFFAGVVWLMAAVIGQGAALAEENASFV